MCFFLYQPIKTRENDRTFYAYMDSPIGRLLMLSDGENLTNLDCELEQTSPNPNWILQEDLPLLKKYDVL